MIDEYRKLLARPARVPWEGCKWEPVRIGPTWQLDESGHWVLPEKTIGWDVLGWCGTELKHGDGNPWRFTLEQARFVLWWYAVDPAGAWLFSDFVLQRLKGWGKDPLGACLIATEMVGPCRFAGWDSDGQPLARDEPEAWIQTAAVAQKQTKNTMRLFPTLFTKEAQAHFGLQIGKTTMHGLGGERLVEAATASPTVLEGARATFVLKNETQHWQENNSGHEMNDVIARNATKSVGGLARRGAITNAFEPSEDSVAQRDREAWEAQVGDPLGTKILYDSLEAPPEAPLALRQLDGESDIDHLDRVRATVTEVVTAVRGDSVWLDPATIVSSVLDTRNPPSQSRRWWYNQVVATEDAWLDPKEIDLTAAALPVDAADEQVLFFDGSKSDDATGLVGCRLLDGHLSMLGVWQRPTGGQGDGWTVNRSAVDQRVREVLDAGNVVAFFADPSHAKDEDATGYWDDMIDGWHRDYGDKFRVWAVASGAGRHSVLWDMTSSARLSLFTAAAETFVTEVQESAAAMADGRPEDRQLTHDGHPMLVQHMRNARRLPIRFGVSLWKGHRESPRKVDLAVCAVGARMLRRMVLNRGQDEKRKKQPGKVWGGGAR